MKKAHIFLVVAMVVLTALSSTATARFGSDSFDGIDRDRPRLVNLTDDYGIITVNIGFIKERVEEVKEKVEVCAETVKEKTEACIEYAYRPADVPIDTPGDRVAKLIAEDTPYEELYENNTGRESDPLATFAADHDTPAKRIIKNTAYYAFRPYGGN